MRLKDLMVPGLLVLIPVVLIIKQPDLGSGILVALVAGSMILFVGVQWRTLMGCGLTLVLLSPVIWHFLKDYQRQRVLTFLNPEKDPLGAGYHILQSMIAVGSGQFWGKGFLQGTQSQLYFLPEQHTDFVFSVFAEEWGFVGSAVLLLLFTGLALWGLQVARECKERFGHFLALGGDGPDLLADIYQPLHGHRFLAGGGHPPAPVQLRRLLPHHHPAGGGISPEYPHAPVLIRGVNIFLQKDFDTPVKIG